MTHTTVPSMEGRWIDTESIYITKKRVTHSQWRSFERRVREANETRKRKKGNRHRRPK